MLTEIVNDKDYWKLYRKQKAEGFLASYIDCFWENRSMARHEVVQTDRSLPHIGFTLRFNLGKPYFLTKGETRFLIHDDIIFPRNHTWKEFYVTNPHVFGIKFKFSFLPYTAKVEHKHFIEKPVPVCGLVNESFVERMHRANSFEERVQVATDFFTQVYDKNQKKISEQKVVLDLLDGMFSKTDRYFKTENIATKNFLSSKTLNRYFQKNIGLTAKSAFKIMRTRTAIEAYTRNGHFASSDWGYYDYSHFFKDVKNLMQLSMSELNSKS